MNINENQSLPKSGQTSPEGTAEFARCEISSDRARLQIDRVKTLLAGTYWACDRNPEDIERSIENSLCFGACLDGVLVGFARIVTDYATTFYLCDVVVDPACRGLGIGKKMVEAAVGDPRIAELIGILATRDAHGLYEHFGFQRDGNRFMYR